ncbi:U32 family peptidase [Streptomonospora alba]|uniref:U32 family peptidase n=1 Tax=Streptomonospora alba TaxID=183763 RepID=UPI00069B148D|nr:U32 family peptidase [Streptomonospora alba]
MPDSAPHPVDRSAALEALGLPRIDTEPPASPLAFPDGGAWRLEIPSVEGPTALDAVLSAAAEWEVPLHRVSQGSGVGMLTDGEITEMVRRCAQEDVELCLFVRPGADWDIGAARDSAAGSVSSRSRGTAQLTAGVAEAERAASLGVRSLLVADEGLLWVLHSMRARRDLPADLQLKVSVMAGPVNPAALAVQERLGADTVNVPSDLTLHQLSELRAAGPVTLDFYVEAPDNVGGFVRHHEIAGIIRAAAPVYVKFGLRNAPGVYPAGEHLGDAVAASSRERVRRARLGLDMLARTPDAPPMSPRGRRAQPDGTRFTPPGFAERGHGPD